MIKTVVIWLLAAAGPIAFLFTCLKLGCGFNFIPFAIHESILGEVLDESTFIILFDTIVAVLLTITIRNLIVRSLSHTLPIRSRGQNASASSPADHAANRKCR